MIFSDLIEIKVKEINKNTIYFSPKVFRWCRLPYPSHKKGCPNYNKNPFCPPNSEILSYKLDNYEYFYLIYAVFQLKKHANNLLKKHPNWSYRKASCLLYWQNSVKKVLREFIKKIQKANLDNQLYLFSSGSGDKGYFNELQKHIYSMEAAGINVFRTLKENNITFEIKPKTFVLIVNLLCSKYKLNLNFNY
ncbi:MAG: DUF2284 domain-containing protein [Promethearchaeota archaeon]